MQRMISWAFSRVAVIYLIIGIFCFTCIDLKMLRMKTDLRHLNDAIPDFSDMILFSKGLNQRTQVDWSVYGDYFNLVFSYMPNDMVIMQLLGYVDYFSGEERKAIDLFKSSTILKGKFLFWSNYNLGVIYCKKGMFLEGQKYLFNAVSSNPKVTFLLIQNSLVYKQIFRSPFFKYNLADELKEAKTCAYILLLTSLRHNRQYGKMIMVANYALQKETLGQRDAFYFYEGLAYYAMGQLKQAYVSFKNSLSIEKENPETYFYLANIYQKAGQMSEARNLYQASYALHQKNDPRFPYDAPAGLKFF